MFGIARLFKLKTGKHPTAVAFSHLYSEYLSLKARIENEFEQKFIEDLTSKTGAEITWNQIYYFELILSNYLPVEKLRSKIMRLREDYRSVAGDKEFDAYLASKPPDLQSPPDPTDPPNATVSQYEKLLREDLRDLLGRMYLEYAILPIREERLTDLTWFAARLCLGALVFLMLILAALFLIPLITEIAQHKGDFISKLNVLRSSEKLSALTVFVVAAAGAMGGFVSALQRIQSPPTEGDSLYNLSLMFHGAYSVFIAPISGSIFAILLYLLFSAGMLSGSFFPTIFTPEGKYAVVAPPERDRPSNSNSATSNAAIRPQAAPPNSNANSNANSGVTRVGVAGSAPVETQPGLGNAASSAPEATANANTRGAPTPTPKAVPSAALNVFDFLASSGPPSGRDYALLIVWCFIAGFAERFVPDALDRPISKGNSSRNS